MRYLVLVLLLLIAGCGFLPRNNPDAGVIPVIKTAPSAHDPFSDQGTYDDANDVSKSVDGHTSIIADPSPNSFPIVQYGQLSVQYSDADPNVHKDYSVTVLNNTNEEVAALTFRMTAYDQRQKKVVHVGPKVRFHFFRNSVFPLSGALLPHNSATITRLRFDYPVDLWTEDTADHVDLVSVETYKGEQDGHFPSHLYTRLSNAKPGDAVALFKANPDLMKVKSDQSATALSMALSTCDLDTIKYLVGQGVSLKDKTFGGATAMDFAALNAERPDVWEFALQHGFSLADKDRNGRTPLFYAALAGSPDCVKWLVKQGANPNAIDNSNHQAVYEVFAGGGPDMLAALVAAGCNPHFHDRIGQGWMHYATIFNRFQDQVAKLGVPVDDAVPPDNITPLMLAATFQYNFGAIWLLKHGADPNKVDKYGEDAYAHSRRSNTLGTDRFFSSYVQRYSKKFGSN